MDDRPFPYQLAASDLDGTLLGPHKEISAANAAAVHRLQAAGARFVLASGRRHQNSLRYQTQLGLDGLLISCAGALVKDPQSGETIHEVLIPVDLADGLVAEGEAAGYTVVYYHRDHLYVTATNHWTELYESRVGEKAERYPGSLRDLKGAAALKIVWYGEPSALTQARPALEKKYADQLGIVATDRKTWSSWRPARISPVRWRSCAAITWSSAELPWRSETARTTRQCCVGPVSACRWTAAASARRMLLASSARPARRRKVLPGEGRGFRSGPAAEFTLQLGVGKLDHRRPAVRAAVGQFAR